MGNSLVRTQAGSCTGPQNPALLVHRRFGIQQQRRHVLDLLFGEDAVMPEARHVRAGGVGLGVIDLAEGVLLDRGAVAAQLAVVVQAGADIAVGELLRRQLVAGVAVAAVRIGGIVGGLFADTGLGNFFAGPPVAQQLSVRRPPAWFP